MTILRAVLLLSTLGIYAITVLAIQSQGWNWPAVFITDLLALDWRSQFNFDFLVHLLLLATWIVWREGATARGYLFGFLSVAMGGMFGFPYLLHATYKARGAPGALLLGVHQHR